MVSLLSKAFVLSRDFLDCVTYNSTIEIRCFSQIPRSKGLRLMFFKCYIRSA